MTVYLIVRSDPRYSNRAATAVVRSFLESRTELVPDGAMAFRAVEGDSVSRVQLAIANECGSYCSDGTELPFTNVIEFMLADEGHAEVILIARKLAAFLDWEFVEEDC